MSLQEKVSKESVEELHQSIFHLVEQLRVAHEEIKNLNKVVDSLEGLLMDFLPEDTDVVDYFFHDDYLDGFSSFWEGEEE